MITATVMGMLTVLPHNRISRAMSAFSSKLAARSCNITIPTTVHKFSNLKNKFKSEKKAGARKRAHLVKSLSSEHEDLSLIPRTCIKETGGLEHHYIPTLGDKNGNLLSRPKQVRGAGSQKGVGRDSS